MTTNTQTVNSNSSTAQEITVVVSSTGYAVGYGTDRWKHVSGLTRDEKAALDAGALVVVTGCRPSNGGVAQTGDTFRKAVRISRGITHRVVRDPAERVAVLAALALASAEVA